MRQSPAHMQQLSPKTQGHMVTFMSLQYVWHINSGTPVWCARSPPFLPLLNISPLSLSLPPSCPPADCSSLLPSPFFSPPLPPLCSVRCVSPHSKGARLGTSRPTKHVTAPTWLARRKARKSSSTAAAWGTRRTGAPWRRCPGRVCRGSLNRTPSITSTTTRSPTSSSSTGTRPSSRSSSTTTGRASCTAPTTCAARCSRRSSPSGASTRPTWRRAAGWTTGSTGTRRRRWTASRTPSRRYRTTTRRSRGTETWSGSACRRTAGKWAGGVCGDPGSGRSSRIPIRPNTRGWVFSTSLRVDSSSV